LQKLRLIETQRIGQGLAAGRFRPVIHAFCDSRGARVGGFNFRLVYGVALIFLYFV
jgi:hypothetical protein